MRTKVETTVTLELDGALAGGEWGKRGDGTFRESIWAESCRRDGRKVRYNAPSFRLCGV